MTIKRRTRKEHLQRILNDYMAEHGDGPVDLADVYRWARRRELWEPISTSLLKQFKEEMAQAARGEYYFDEQGRDVRKKHAVVTKDEEGKPHSLWADIESAPPEH